MLLNLSVGAVGGGGGGGGFEYDICFKKTPWYCLHYSC